MPSAFWIERMCEAFHCLPSEAEREARIQPVGWLEEILEARHYAECYHLWTTAKRKADVPDSPMMQVVKEIEFALVAEERKAQEANG
jgi:hypothetical protein